MFGDPSDTYFEREAQSYMGLLSKSGTVDNPYLYLPTALMELCLLHHGPGEFQNCSWQLIVEMPFVKKLKERFVLFFCLRQLPNLQPRKLQPLPNLQKKRQPPVVKRQKERVLVPVKCPQNRRKKHRVLQQNWALVLRGHQNQVNFEWQFIFKYQKKN